MSDVSRTIMVGPIVLFSSKLRSKMRTGTILLPLLAAFACISHSNGDYNTFRSDRHYFLYSLLRTIPYSGPAQCTVQPRVTLPDLSVSDLARRLLLTKCCGMTWVPVPRLLTK